MVTIREFAKQVDRSHVFIMRLAKQGIIPRNEDGTIPLAAGLEAFQAYDSAPKNKGGRPKKGEGAKIKKSEIETETETPAVNDPEQRQEAVSINTALRKANLAERTYRAKLRELEYKMKSGELLEKAAVSEAITKAVSDFQAKMRSIPPRISAVCEMRMARDIEDIMLDAIEASFSDLKKLEKQHKASDE